MDGSDDSLKAADQAVVIASLHGSKLLVVHVVPSQTRTSTTAPASENSVLNNAIDTWFERIKHNAQDARVDIETRVVSTGYSVGQVLVDLAEKEKVDLIVVGTRGTTGFKKLLLGSAALEVVSYSDCSVMIVK